MIGLFFADGDLDLDALPCTSTSTFMQGLKMIRIPSVWVTIPIVNI